MRNIDTPHLPHGWDVHVLYEETTRTLFCGDLFTRLRREPGDHDVDDIVEPSLACEAFGAPTALDADDCADDRARGDLGVDTLALMHGPTYQGDCTKALLDLADGYARMYTTAVA